MSRVIKKFVMNRARTPNLLHHSLETEVFINITHTSNFKILNLSFVEVNNDPQMYANEICLFRALEK
jgi:hypothetical protein